MAKTAARSAKPGTRIEPDRKARRLVEQVAGRTVARNMRVSLVTLRRMLEEREPSGR